MKHVIDEASARTGISIDQISPDAWLEAFYNQRKGSGKTAKNEDANNRGLSQKAS
jgi:type IV secretion system protein VirB4